MRTQTGRSVRTVLYTGKGGVGKTTSAAATAVWAAAQGQRTLIASADAAHSLGDVLELRLGPDPVPIHLPGDGRGSRLVAVEIDARAEIERHWGAVRDYLVRIFRYQGIEEVVADELALLPGLDELATLLAVDAWANEGAYDLVVVDCAPTDSALRLLTFPEAAHGALRTLLRLQQAITRVVTPLARNLVTAPLPDAAVFREAEDLIYRQMARLRARIDDRGTSVRLVVTPERMVIDEALRARTDLALFDVRCDAVVLNRLLPDEAAAEPYFADWRRQQEERTAEIEEAFAPLPILRAPLQDDEVTGLERLLAQGRTLFAGHPPEALLCRLPGLEFRRSDEPGGFELQMPLPRTRPEDLDVAKLEDRLFVGTGERRRPVALPRHLAGLDLVSARLDGGTLLVRFSPPPAARPDAP